MTKAAQLRAVPDAMPEPKPPYDADKAERRMKALRQHLLNAAVRWVTETTAAGQQGRSRPERIRMASDITGIPATLIASAMEQKK